MDLKSKIKPNRKRVINCSVYLIIIAIGIVLDQITKAIAVKFLKNGAAIPVINGIFQWNYVENRGAAWGMLANQRWIFMTISTIAIVVMLAYLYLTENESRLYTVSISIIASGGIGNMIDRVFLGYVVDFMDFCLIDFPVFNVADSLVCIGAGLLILALILDIIKEGKRLKSEKGDKDKK